MKKLREHISLKAIITSVMILSLIIASCSFDLKPVWKNSEKTAIGIPYITTDIPAGKYSFIMTLFSAMILDKLNLFSLNFNFRVSEIEATGLVQFTYQSLNDFYGL